MKTNSDQLDQHLNGMIEKAENNAKPPSSAGSFSGWYVVWRKKNVKAAHSIPLNSHGEYAVAAYPTKHLADKNPNTLPTDTIRRND